ncbi:CCA tRNA nucleotidyltransferase [Sulfurimonas sp.]
MFEYPNILNIIFDKLNKFNIKPIIVGGFVRDALLQMQSKDIDIELYGIDSLSDLENILKEFGSVNSVGKSFGVVKLHYKNLDLDFSLPRRDNKIAKGHRGFTVEVDAKLTFTQAAQRRDFTINAMGYDVVNKKLLDPYNGKEDLQNKILRAVDINKFGEDPLRVLRAIGFVSRFDLTMHKTLFNKCKEMFTLHCLDELPLERIYIEMQKIVLKSPRPSLAMKLLKDLGGFTFFKELSSLNNEEFKVILEALDRYAGFKTNNKKRDLAVMFAILSSQFSPQPREKFFKKICADRSLLEEVELLNRIEFKSDSLSNYDIYVLASQVNIELYTLYKKALNDKDATKIIDKATNLGVLHHKLPALISGKDLISLNLSPSKEFTNILNRVYDAQLKGCFSHKDDALLWIQKNLLP